MHNFNGLIWAILLAFSAAEAREIGVKNFSGEKLLSLDQATIGLSTRQDASSPGNFLAVKKRKLSLSGLEFSSWKYYLKKKLTG